MSTNSWLVGRAPELDGGNGWLNTAAPLTLKDLRGKAVLLDFWTYGCINCMHVLPDLEKLEKKYGSQLVIIGVHSAKFSNEKEIENLRRIMVRYGVTHPVLNDSDFAVWQRYGVQAWPTLVLIDPAGYIVGSVAGEGYYGALDKAIGSALEAGRRRGQLMNSKALPLALEQARFGDLPLKFPGKVLASDASQRLFVSDSSHNRIVIARLDGVVLDVVGSGRAGSSDGSFEQACFNRPQGLALDGDRLYVADTENHLIRLVDLKTRQVHTLAGTGKPAEGFLAGGPARTTALSSPWDLALAGQLLYIAMAGKHQIWKLDFSSSQLSVIAGTGEEARRDGVLKTAGFAQPSGLAYDGKRLYVADSESNIIRAIDVERGAVQTLAGGDLFDFGDRDGRPAQARFQHPLGVAVWEGNLLIADTYNHKIRLLDLEGQKVETFAGTGKAGQVDGLRPAFYEPGGLSIAGGKLYLADTNNHAVRILDLKTHAVSTLRLIGLKPPASKPEADTSSSVTPNRQQIAAKPERLPLAHPARLIINVPLPEGYHLNPEAPQRYQVKANAGLGVSLQSPGTSNEGLIAGPIKAFPLVIPLQAKAAASEGELTVQLTLYVCREDNTGACHIKTLVWQVPVKISGDYAGPPEIKLGLASPLRLD